MPGMKSGFTPLILLAVIGLLVIAGISGFVVAKNYTSLTKPRAFSFFGGQNNGSGDLPSVAPNVRIPPPKIASPTPTTDSNGTGENATSVSTNYSDPLGYFSLILPSDWVVGTTDKEKTYTTIRFDGPNGHISVTSGDGKDPIGGCSESTNIQIAQKTILGCFLLQKDGSQILTRGYTDTAGGIQLTIEAYINPPLETNKQIILDIIKTIVVN